MRSFSMITPLVGCFVIWEELFLDCSSLFARSNVKKLFVKISHVANGIMGVKMVFCEQFR